jgi:hypothetical protein
MKHQKIRFMKSLVILVALALFATAMVNGGATANEAMTPSISSLTALSSPTALGQASMSGVGHTVFVKRLKEPTKEGNALLILQFDGRQMAGRRLTININDGPVTFRDDGKGGDEVARDNRLSAVVDLDFAALTANQSRIKELSAGAKGAPTMPIFEGRVIVGEQELSLPLSSSELQPGQEVAFQPMAFPGGIDPERSLIIRDPSVVEDPLRTFNPCTGVGTPMGKWTFGFLMQEMANQPMTGIDPSNFTRAWLKHWEANLLINGWGVPMRQAVKDIVIDPWVAASGGPGMPLDLKIAPFRLLAIINRIDLRGNSGYTTNNAGEARFVFGVIDRRRGGCQVSEMTVILEYGIDKNTCDEIITWAKDWVNLSSLPLGSPLYNDALEKITDQFSLANAAPTKVNGSALNQVRTNEFLPPHTGPWELREFRLTMTKEDPLPPTGQLLETTVKQTPDEIMNGKLTLRDYINLNCGPLLAGNHIVPLNFPRNPGDPPMPNPPAGFLGGNSFVPPDFWNAPGIACDPSPPGNARFNFSNATCSGCHRRETFTAFYHIIPTPFGVPAGLSPLLSGPLAVPDPVNGFVRNFDEILRRAIILDQVANGMCKFALSDIFNRIEIKGDKGILTSGQSGFVH